MVKATTYQHRGQIAPIDIEESYVLTCPVCQIVELEVTFRPAGTDFGDPAELVEVEPVGEHFCECYESGMVDQSAYDEKLLERAISAHSLCGSPLNHGPTRRTRKAVS